MPRRHRSPPIATLSSAAAVVLAAALVAAGCSDGTTAPPGNGENGGNGGNGGNGDDGGDVSVALREVATGLESPTYLTSPPGDERIFVLEQPGTVRLLRDGELREDPYLDVSDAVTDGGEQGLLGLAFHPDFAQNGRLYLDFTVTGGDTRVVEYTVDPTADRVDPGPADADTLIGVEQPFANHNGGMLAFGPDRMLYVALGDGGDAGDPRGNGQDSTTVLGSILRLDVDGPDLAPDDNPFVGRDGRDEIWAYGLRNPWRFAFDPPSGTLFVADVGQDDVEEVNAVAEDEAGVNYGWNVMEGSECFEPPSGCDRDGLTLPVLDYPNNADNCSVTGGFVYRGADVPGIEGRYFFSDLCSAFLRSFRLEGGEAVDEVEHDVEIDGTVTSFGTDADGELYVLTGGGTVLRIVDGE